MFRILLILSLVMPSLHARAADWTFLYQRDGFRVFTLPGDPPSYRAEGKVEVPFARLAAVLADIPRHHEWIERLAESRILEGDALHGGVIYQRYDLPWPARNRQVLVESVVEEDVSRGEVTVRFRRISPASRPAPFAGTGKCIWIPVLEGNFLLKDLGEEGVFVRYTVRIDPGGRLPGWIVRPFIREAPARTLNAFQLQVERTRRLYGEFLARHRERWAPQPAETTNSNEPAASD